MSRFSLRPQSWTFGLFGNGRTKAFDDERSSTRETLHKLTTLEPLAAQREVLADSGHSARKVMALIKSMDDAQTRTSAKPRSAVTKSLIKLGRKAAIAVGLKHGKPQPHVQLLRYANTSLNNDLEPAIAALPAALHDAIPTLVRTLASEQTHLHAQIEANHAIGVDALLTHEMTRIQEEDHRIACQRAVNLPDRAHRQRQQRNALAELLRRERAAVVTATDALGVLQEQLPVATQALAHELSLLVQGEKRQDAAVSHLEERLRHARLTAREAAVTLHVGRASATGHLLEQRIAHANEEIETIAAELAGARAELLALRQMRQGAQTIADASVSAPIGDFPMNRLSDTDVYQDGHQLSQLAQRVAQLKDNCREQRMAIQQHQERAHELEQRERDLEVQFRQTVHSSTVNARQLAELDEQASDMTALRQQLQTVLQRKTGVVLETSRKQAQEARVELDQKLQTLLSRALSEMPYFLTGQADEQIRQSLLEWTDGLDRTLAVFGAEAFPPLSLLTLAMQALSIAVKESPGKALATLNELRTVSLYQLIAPLNDSIDASPDHVPALSEAARATLGLLVLEPRGMQVVSHLLAQTERTPSKEHYYAARIYLLADEALHHSSPADVCALAYFENAQRAARRALHASSVNAGLATATVDERAAYYGFRNGYRNNAAGSTYQKANQHLQMLADWQHAAVASVAPWENSATSPFHALHEALTLATATVLPTPARRARDELGKAAGHLLDYTVARRQQLAPGQLPIDAELTLQALAEHVQRTPIEIDILTLKLDATALRSISQRRQSLQQHFGLQESQRGVTPQRMPSHAETDAMWQALNAKVYTLPQALSLLQQQLLEPQPPLVRQASEDAAYWAEQEAKQRTRFHVAIGKVNALLYDGNLDRAAFGQTFGELFTDMLQHLEWRDKLRFAQQNVRGINLAPLAAALAVLGLPIGGKVILAFQINEEMVIEFYMGRTGPYMQIGKQNMKQGQAGAGFSGGCLWSLSKQLRMGAGWSGDLRIKKESGIEQGVQLRVPRRSKGHYVEIIAQFLDVFKHLVHLGKPLPDGAAARRDWMRELLAHHPTLNIGLIDNAARETTSSESNFSAGAMLRLCCFGVGATGGVKNRQDMTHTDTTVAGNMTTIYKDATAQTRSEFSVRLGASLRAFWKKRNVGGQTGFFDLGYGREIRAKGQTHFCTMFTFDDEIDPVRTDRAIDFLNFREFEQEIRNNWDAWIHYGTPKLASQIDENMRHVVAEKQLENFLDETRTFTRDNKLTTMYVDYTLKAETAPILDALRAEASLWRKSGRENLAQRAERDFDDLMTEPALWEPAILVLREKTKLQVERGIDFFIKVQKNRLAESQRTVGQWVQYETVERAEPGQEIDHVSTWE